MQLVIEPFLILENRSLASAFAAALERGPAIAMAPVPGWAITAAGGDPMALNRGTAGQARGERLIVPGRAVLAAATRSSVSTAV